MSDVLVHPTAIVASANIGAGTRVWAFTHILEGATIGRDCNIGDHCFVEGGAIVGDGVTIKNGNAVWEGVTLEDGVFVGPGVLFTNDLFPRSPRLPESRSRYLTRAWLTPTVVRRGASLGAGSVLICGVTVGQYALVGAGAIVTHDVSPFALVVGSPARTIGWVCLCGDRLVPEGSRTRCSSCGAHFVIDDEGARLAPGEHLGHAGRMISERGNGRGSR